MKHNQVVQYYAELMKEHLQQKYLDEKLQKTPIEDHKLYYLYCLTKGNQEQDTYIVSTMLVQMALNTHDFVYKDFKTEEKHSVKNQQLTVLAGDYYSGIFYHLLARKGEISFIQQLAQGIHQLTKAKMDVFETNYASLTDFLLAYQSIDSALLTTVTHYFDETTLDQIIEKWILLQTLEKERLKIDEGKDSVFQRLVLELVNDVKSIQQLRYQLADQMERLIIQVKEEQGQCPEWMLQWIEVYDFDRHIQGPKTDFVEEG
ncbi:heptaprenyl diphosphate synthase component I [Gracilibacillus halophilus YIM-C55.5]|uniref:Heptaprenyl diphosphate synthase component I n=1 Tax=Gracilibacillus halophilus YIM-C55.5 TaxID=1308866 RepID=N4WAL2_9BACI|nr:heptaprenyl diphosphate synthase component 1 [Gracilibacillus halophilus]ENH97343.1 heptaprenyl diphosphate synthase component I [Gracilibacillus halophilus YIM-C55.5]